MCFSSFCELQEFWEMFFLFVLPLGQCSPEPLRVLVHDYMALHGKLIKTAQHGPWCDFFAIPFLLFDQVSPLSQWQTSFLSHWERHETERSRRGFKKGWLHIDTKSIKFEKLEKRLVLQLNCTGKTLMCSLAFTQEVVQLFTKYWANMVFSHGNPCIMWHAFHIWLFQINIQETLPISPTLQYCLTTVLIISSLDL